MPPDKIIALLTDFGNDDPFVGIMKGVIAEISPQAKLIDITHNIPPGDIRRAAVMLWQLLPYFPSRTIFLTVVDPGVGTSRKGIIAQSGDNIFVGPDNGVFSFVCGDDSVAWELTNPQFQLLSKGRTFHGRDVFAPAAAYSAIGTEISQFGPQIEDFVHIPKPQLKLFQHQIHGEVLYSDRFGNLLTSLGCFSPTIKNSFNFEPWVSENNPDTKSLIITRDKSTITLADGRNLIWVETFSDLAEGECGFLVGSSGLIEIVANRKNAGELLKLYSGDQLILNF